MTQTGPGSTAAAAVSPWEHDRAEADGTDFGDPPMVMAIRGKGSIAEKIRLCTVLKQFGLSVDARSPRDSWTPLLAAVEQGSLQLCTALLKLGARLSSDRQLGFTPLHLACQMGHWHILPCLVEAMQGQYGRVAAWGPSPQYVSLNLSDAYGRTALDIALLRYFSNPFGASAESSNGKPINERQKAVDILREFIHQKPSEDPGVLCGWELLHVLNLLDAPSKKALSAQLIDCERLTEGAPASRSNSGSPSFNLISKEEGQGEELLQAVKILVQAGAQTRLLQDLVLQPQRAGSE
eukprot:CAMPEP_0197638310 /NCGR_PEP_ID=MMETSP1338-20131121/13281_1 /TAXON_ID=43686 ORGANISM="Pelagodinium beii, Strain RCC1491" /NCGR_SAMPLE_ID=MMETSP1338 /ASSEMBLY_ACC=CAM_ASM_000754 /LENGTH=293 /DNA_ID=CAMNT_0043210863 /DNA_START=37 /DNA_END=915 /DNA_ORIENTATION=-